MRLKFALPALAVGLVTGWAATAAAAAPPTAPVASAPPAAPIFYCPSSPKGAPAAPGAKPQACPTAPPAAPAVAHRRLYHRREMRIVERRVVGGTARASVDWRAADLSAGQKYVQDYELRHHGLDIGPDNGAWRNAGPPQREWAEAPPAPRVIVERAPAPPQQVIVERAPPPPQQVIVERAPPPPPQVIIEREAPPPPKIIIEHPPAPPPQVVFERAPAPPPQVIYDRGPPPCPERCPPPRDAYGWQDRGEGGRVVIERRETERAGGWSYSEQNGRGYYQAWGDARRGRPCPPQVPQGGCAADAGSGGYGSDEWRESGYGGAEGYAGRDAYGYLVWPGK